MGGSSSSSGTTSSQADQSALAAQAQAHADQNTKVKPLTPSEQRKADAEAQAAQEQLRILFAKTTENRLLGAGYDVDVIAYGTKHKLLKLKWVLTNKVLAYQFSQSNGEMLESMRKLGFTRFTITDGYDSTWYWDLTKD